jgi:tetratricopeptide (TPR) repeat protein
VAWGLAGLTVARAEDRWLRVATREFTVVTSLREKEALKWATEFSQYVAALRAYFQQEQRVLTPLTFVVFARERDFEQYRPLGADGRPQEVAGFFLQRGAWAVAGLGGTQVREELRRTIFHEGVHWFLSGREQPNPVWIEEGLAEVFSTFSVVKHNAEWGRAIDEHIRLLRQQGLLPLPRLLQTGHEDLFGRDLEHTSMVYAQSWAFVHFLIFGRQDLAHGALARYAQLSATAMDPDEAFRQGFGKTYAEMERELQRYIETGKYFLRSRPLAEFTPPTAEPATPVVVADALARLALAGRRWAVAATQARAAITAAPDDPRGHDLLGIALSEAGDAAGARQEFENAIAHGSRSAQSYFDLAVEEQNAFAKGDGDGTMSPEAARRIANRYEQAINLYPRFHVAYQNLAGVVGVAEPWGEQDRRFLALGRRLWPDDAMIAVGEAILARRAGELAVARAELDRVLASTSGDGREARAFARRLDGNWEQQDVISELNRLIEAAKYPEAVAFIDTQLNKGVSTTVRAQLVSMRGPLSSNVAWQGIGRAMEAGEWGEARRALNALLDGEAPAAMKTQARRTLADLDRQRLGLEPPGK